MISGSSCATVRKAADVRLPLWIDRAQNRPGLRAVVAHHGMPRKPLPFIPARYRRGPTSSTYDARAQTPRPAAGKTGRKTPRGSWPPPAWKDSNHVPIIAVKENDVRDVIFLAVAMRPSSLAARRFPLRRKIPQHVVAVGLVLGHLRSTRLRQRVNQQSHRAGNTKPPTCRTLVRQRHHAPSALKAGSFPLTGPHFILPTRWRRAF